MLARSFILKTAALRPVELLVRKSFFFKPLVRRFVAGNNLEEAMSTIEALAARGFGSALDLLGEGITTEDEAIRAKNAYIDMLARVDRSPAKRKIYISIKLTQCGLAVSDALAEKHYREVLAAAAERGIFVRVDMEDSPYTERTLAMIERVFSDFPNTGTVLQSYLYRSVDDTRRMIGLGASIRVVKGAYLEPESVAHQSKKTVDEKYVEMSKMLIAEGNFPAIATHDEAIIREICDWCASEGIGKDRFEFQMLYGIRRDLQERLLDQGYGVRVYVPFGESWYPYFTRRLAERPANAMFILKSLLRR